MFLDFSNQDKTVRSIALIEGLSYLVLVLISMPLKHFAGIKEATKVSGYLHGLLFVILMLALTSVVSSGKWNIKKAIYVFVLSLIPAGAFIAERKLKKEERAQ